MRTPACFAGPHQSGHPTRGAGGGRADPAAPWRSPADQTQPAVPPAVALGRAGRVHPGRHEAYRPGAVHRLHPPGKKRLSGSQSVHHQGDEAAAQARSGGVRERAAAGSDRAEESRQRTDRHLERLQPDPDLQGRDCRPVQHQRGGGGQRWLYGTAGLPDGRYRAHAGLAGDQGRERPAREPGRIQKADPADGAGNSGKGVFPSGTLSGLRAPLRAVRNERRPHHQENCRLPPVPCRAGGSKGHHHCRQPATEPHGGGAGAASHLRPGGTARQPQGWGGVAYAGLGQEHHHGLLRRQAVAAARDEEPHTGGGNRPQRPGRAAVCHLQRGARPAAPDTGAGRQSG